MKLPLKPDEPVILYRHAVRHSTDDGEVTIKPNDSTSVIVVGAENKEAALAALATVSRGLDELRRFIESQP